MRRWERDGRPTAQPSHTPARVANRAGRSLLWWWDGLYLVDDAHDFK